MLGAIVYEAGPESDMDYDIVLEERSGHPKRINKLHPSYMSLQFPLLFIYGEDGYSKDLKTIGPTNSSSEDRRLTMLAYYSYYLHDRANRYNYLSRTGKLFQQYVGTAFCAIEQNRIDYIREHQNDIRNDYLSGIYDAINRGDNDGFDLWADIVDWVFEMKIHQFISYLRDVQPFGKVAVVLYTVEFQKRGLPHCHTLLWIDEFVRGTDRVAARISRSHPTSTADDTTTSTNRPQIEIDEIKNYLDARYRVVFRETDQLDSLVLNSHKKKTTLTEWLYYNEQNADGRHLTYLNFPSEYVWYLNGKFWRRRRIKTKSSIGRLAYVHPAAGDLFYQRMLLCHQTGCTSFPGIRTVNDVIYPTCRDACQALGLLQDDQEWEVTLQEAALTATPAELRTLLAYIFDYCELSDPKKLWERTWKIMSEDIPYVCSISLNLPALHIDDSDLEDYTLYEFETCKTFLWKTILYTLRCEKKIVLVVASSGIASLLLPAGRTAHSRFKIPLDLTDTSVYRTLRDILSQPNHLFGSKTVMLGGHFRQTLPVKRGASRNEIIRSSIANSYLWPHFKIHYLTENMRLNNRSSSEIDKHRTTMFAQWLLDVGNGQIGMPDDSYPENTSWVDIPDEYCIPNDDNGIPNLINFIYDADTLHHPSAEKL
ncbi:DNA helicase [Tanacetum coccineum]